MEDAMKESAMEYILNRLHRSLINNSMTDSKSSDTVDIK